MQPHSNDSQETDLPHNIGRPARDALTLAGYLRLEQLTAVSEAQLLKLHGVGSKAIERLRVALKERGLSFADEKNRGNP